MPRPSWRAEALAVAKRATSVEVDMAVAARPELVELWAEWCEWREELCQADRSKPWTPRAARMEMRSLAVALDKHTPDAIAGRIRTAIAGAWRGLCLDTMRPEWTPPAAPRYDYTFPQ